MRNTSFASSKIHTLESVLQHANLQKFKSKKVVFTNGVFDILHEGHIASLSAAAAEGDYLIVAINSDASTKRLKGENRPINNEKARALVIASLLIVDAVIIFEEDTPLNVIKTILPDVLVKGGDYKVEEIAGAKEVITNGGRVVINPLVDGVSTTNIISKLS